VAGLSGAPAWAAYTWEGVWSSTFGDIKMDAGGAGTYPGGTISGGITGEDGRTNKGTWQESSTNGNYEFHLSESGRAFDGTYERAGGGCVFPPCDWDGACISGPCRQNSAPERESCTRPRECQYEIRFGFDLRRGLPAEPPRRALAEDLVSVDAHTEGARLFSDEQKPEGGEFLATGDLEMATRYREDGEMSRGRIIFRVGTIGYYDRSPRQVSVDAHLRNVYSTDPNCPMGADGFMQLEARKRDSGEKELKLVIATRPNSDDELIPCLETNGSRSHLVWKTNDFKSFKIGRPRDVKFD
jgi:hypothetical protein